MNLHEFVGIRIFEGTLGGGKTYSAVCAMAAHVAKGLTCFTNVELDPEGFKALVLARYGVEIEPGQIVVVRNVEEFHKETPSGQRGAPVLGVIDEAHLFFNARDWKNASKKLLEFLTLCRKLHTNLIFISQSAFNIDTQFRRLVGSFVAFRDLRQWTVPGLGVSYATLMKLASFGMSSGGQLLCCLYDRDGRTMLRKEFISLDPAVFRSYRTESLLVDVERSGSVGKRDLKRIRPRVRGATFLAVLLVLIVAAVGFVWWRHGGKDEASAKAGDPVKSALPVPASLQPGSEVQRLTPSSLRGPRLGLIVERFVGYYGATNRPILKTDNHSYEVGEMSGRGYVRAVSDRRAVVWDGHTSFFVIAEEPSLVEAQAQADRAYKLAAEAEAREDARLQRLDARNAKIQSAEWKPERSEFAAQVDADHKAELRRPVGAANSSRAIR